MRHNVHANQANRTREWSVAFFFDPAVPVAVVTPVVPSCAVLCVVGCVLWVVCCGLCVVGCVLCVVGCVLGDRSNFGQSSAQVHCGSLNKVRLESVGRGSVVESYFAFLYFFVLAVLHHMFCCREGMRKTIRNKQQEDGIASQKTNRFRLG